MEDFYVDKLEKSCRNNFDNSILESDKLDPDTPKCQIEPSSKSTLMSKDLQAHSKLPKTSKIYPNNLTLNTNFNNITRPVKLNGITPIKKKPQLDIFSSKAYKSGIKFKKLTDAKNLYRRSKKSASKRKERSMILLRNRILTNSPTSEATP